MDDEKALEQAISAARSGDRQAARRLLAGILRRDPRNAGAWLWMSGVVDDDAQRIECLQRALTLDPENRAAPAGHQLIETHKGQEVPSPRLQPPLARESQLPDAEPGTLVPPPTAEAGGHSSPLPRKLDPVFAIQEQPPLARHAEDGPQGLDEARRRRGYRNVMLGGAMTLTMLCGLALLLVVLTQVVPQARERLHPLPPPALYTATLWCPPCAEAGSRVILWEKPGDAGARGAKAGELEHGTLVSVLAEEWSPAEGRMYLQVAAQGKKGWVPATLTRR
jgi:hypothetical protein